MLKYTRLAFGLSPHLIKAGLWIGRYSRGAKKIPLEKRYARVRKLVNNAFNHFHVNLIIEGEENIPTDTNFLLVPNHQSLMDPVILISLFEKPISFVSKEETKKVPYIGKIIKAIDGIFMERNNLRQEIRVIQKVSTSLEESSLIWVIFPEGTRTKDSEFALTDFKAGSLKPAFNAEKPILPVVIHGTRPVFDRKAKQKNNTVQIAFLKPYMPCDLAEKNTSEIATIIQKDINEKLQSFIEKEKKGFNI